MMATGLFFLPFEANTPTPATALSQHISRRPTAQPLSPFWLEYRLLVDTSSLLPGAQDTRRRRATQIITLSQFSDKTYVLTEPEDGTASSMITLPSGPGAQSFFTMIMAKMQPLWTARNEFRIDKGTAVELKDGALSIRVGELRTTVGQGAGKVRGTIIAVSDSEMGEDGDDEGEREVTWRGLLEGLFRGSGIHLANTKLIHNAALKQKGDPEHAEIVRLYADLLKMAAPSGQR